MAEKERITAQLSLYALGRPAYKSDVDAAILTLELHGLNPKVGPLSTVVTGAPDTVFGAIRAVFQRANEGGPSVLTVTLANATPEEILGDKYPLP